MKGRFASRSRSTPLNREEKLMARRDRAAVAELERAPAPSASENPRAVFAVGRGSRGKTVAYRWMIDRALNQGWQFIAIEAGAQGPSATSQSRDAGSVGDRTDRRSERRRALPAEQHRRRRHRGRGRSARSEGAH